MGLTPTFKRVQDVGVGGKVRVYGEEWIVELVNECRARLRPVRLRPVKLVDPETGEEREFEAKGRPISISPGAEVEIVGEEDH